MLTLKLAYRNLWRNKRRTQLTMGAMIFACALLVFTLGYYDGMFWTIINNATEKESGHICLSAKGYLDNPSLNKTINNDQIASLPANILKEIKGVTPRIDAFALLSSGKDENSRTQPAQIMGIDPEAETKFSRMSQMLIKGNFLEKNINGILLGKGLAQKLRVKTGEEIVLMSNGADGSLVSDIFNVEGIFDSGDSMRDSNLALFNIKKLQELFVLENQVHSFRFFIKDPLKAKELAKVLAQQKPRLESLPWHEIFPQIAMIIDMWVGMQIFTMVIYYSALVLITFNTMYMAFLERRREFAVIGAIGMTKLKLSWLILTESLVISTISGLVGAIVGTAGNFLLFYFPIDLSIWMEAVSWGGSTITPKFFCVPSALNCLLPLISMILLGFVVAAFPAWKIYRLKPVESLREV
jgi:ABC-type lipoprotein release transport system permease subunit